MRDMISRELLRWKPEMHITFENRLYSIIRKKTLNYLNQRLIERANTFQAENIYPLGT